MYTFIQDEDVDGFEIIRAVNSNGMKPTITFPRVFFPFGVNKDKSLKMDILDREMEIVQKNFNKIYTLCLECKPGIEKVLGTDVILNTRLLNAQRDLEKKRYNPTITGHLNYMNKRLITMITSQKGLPPGVDELKCYHAKVVLQCDAFWIKQNVVFGGKWKIKSITV